MDRPCMGRIVGCEGSSGSIEQWADAEREAFVRDGSAHTVGCDGCMVCDGSVLCGRDRERGGLREGRVACAWHAWEYAVGRYISVV